MAKSREFWRQVRLTYETKPVSTYALAKQFDVTRQAIDKRAKKEGWQKCEGEALQVAEVLPICNTKGKQGVRLGSRSPENIAQAIEIVRKTGNEGLAAAAIGVHQDTLRRWKSEDPDFAAEMQAARARKLYDWADSIDRAASKDWKAAAYQLERAPETREQYGTRLDGSGGTTVILSISRGSDSVTIDGETVAYQEG